jgi:predicted O-methyltransferase YrrM
MDEPMDSRITATLERLHREADRDLPRIAVGFARSLGRKLAPDHMRDAWIAIDRAQGRWLMDLAIRLGARNIVEFGTSFGVSAVWLGAAGRETHGRVTTTEIEPGKVRAARAHLAEAGLDDIVTVLEGDAAVTLADHQGPVDLLFFDGWSDRYRTLLDLLEPKLAEGAVLLIDNATMPGTRGFVRALGERPGWTPQPAPSPRMAVARFATASHDDGAC